MLTGPLDDERRGEALFGGDLLIFKDVAPLRRFSRLVGELVRAVFGDAPQHAQFDLSPEEFTARANHLVTVAGGIPLLSRVSGRRCGTSG